MRRLVRALLLAMLVVGVVATPAAATPAASGDTLGRLWTTILQTPSPQNSFGAGGLAAGCWRLGGTVAPLGPETIPTCTVKPGTKLFVLGSSVECSTFEGNGTTEAALRACARAADRVRPTVTLDGRPVRLTEVESAPLRMTLPADNLFELPAGSTGLSVAHGWAALLHPLTPGTHTIGISGPFTGTTTIVVQRRA